MESIRNMIVFRKGDTIISKMGNVFMVSSVDWTQMNKNQFVKIQVNINVPTQNVYGKKKEKKKD